MDIAEQLETYVAVSGEVHAMETQIQHELHLLERAELLQKVLRMLEPAEKKYAEEHSELTKRRRQDKASNSRLPTAADRRYNQLLIKYNMAQSEAKNWERSYSELKVRHQRTLKERVPAAARSYSRSSFHTTPYLPRLKDNVSLRSPMATATTATATATRHLASPKVNAVSTPSPSARRILSEIRMSPARSPEAAPTKPPGSNTGNPGCATAGKLASLERAESAGTDDFSFERITDSDIKELRGTKRPANGRVALKRSTPEMDDDSPTAKRMRAEEGFDDDESGTDSKENSMQSTPKAAGRAIKPKPTATGSRSGPSSAIFSKVRTIRGGGAQISPLKMRNQGLSRQIMGNQNR